MIDMLYIMIKLCQRLRRSAALAFASSSLSLEASRTRSSEKVLLAAIVLSAYTRAVWVRWAVVYWAPSKKPSETRRTSARRTCALRSLAEGPLSSGSGSSSRARFRWGSYCHLNEPRIK